MEWVATSSPTASSSRSVASRPIRTEADGHETRPSPARLPSGDHGRPTPTLRPARSPASASSTAPRSWPGRIARCCSATSGAEVIKVEPPEGDATRGWGPPWVGPDEAGDADGRLLPRDQPQQARHAARPQDRPRAPGSSDACSPMRDVLVENARVGGFARLGFDDATLARRSTRGSSTSRSPAMARPAGRRPAGLRLRRSRPRAG